LLPLLTAGTAGAPDFPNLTSPGPAYFLLASPSFLRKNGSAISVSAFSGDHLMLVSCLSSYLFSAGELSHADPVVPILIASIFITLGAALGGLMMKWINQP